MADVAATPTAANALSTPDDRPAALAFPIFAVLAASLILLSLAAAPPWVVRGVRFAELAAYRRVEVAAIGGAMLVLAAVGYVLLS